jgi:pimeloyl-ACP methyl ester carboxylesterase
MEGPPQSPLERKEQAKALREQFVRTEKHFVGKTEIESHDIVPERLKSEVPVFFGTGWSASKGVYEASIVGIANEGRRVTSLYAPHGVETDEKFGEGGAYAEVELKKAAAMLKILEDKAIEQIDIVAHSESAIWSLIVASIHPEKVRNIVLIDPAGLIGEDSLSRLGISFSLDVVREELNLMKHPRPEVERSTPLGMKDLLQALGNIVSKPLESLKAVLAIKNADIRDMLRMLKSQGKRIAVINGADDVVFPMDKMVQTVGPHRGAYASMVDGFYSVYGEHNELNRNPEGYNRVINHALDALERLSYKTS